MIALVVALVLSGPPSRTLHECVTACHERGAVFECYFDELRTCASWQVECPRGRRDVVCRPRAVSLGVWDGVEFNYSPSPMSWFPVGALNVPGPFGEYPTERPAP